jgi:PAS domain S-box-containing protein
MAGNFVEFSEEVKSTIHRHGRRQIALERISREANTNPDLSSLLQTSLDESLKALGGDYCHILKHLSLENELLLIAWTGNSASKEGTYIPFNPGILPGFVIGTRKKGHFANFRRRSRLGSPDLPGSNGVSSGISALISIREAPYGVIEAYCDRNNAFDAEDLLFLESVSHILASAIDRYRVEEEYRRINDILERQVSGRGGLVHLFREVLMVANEASTIPEVLQSTLNSICTQTGWPVGHVVLAPKTKGEPLQSTPWWFLADQDRFKVFQDLTEQTIFRPGYGLPGTVYDTGKPQWVKDANLDLLVRSEAIRHSGLSSAFAFPVTINEEVVAVMELFNDEVKEPDYLLLDGLVTMGVQLGRIVERLRNIQRMEAEEQKLIEAQQIARLGSWEWDIETDVVTWSEMVYEIFGIPPEGFNGTFGGYLELIHPDDREMAKQTILDAYQNRATYEFDHRFLVPNSGEVRYLRAKGKVVVDEQGQPVRMVGTGQDITDRKRLDEELRAQGELLRSVVTSAPIIFWAVNKEGIITVVEGKALGLLGVEPGTNIGKSISELMPADLPFRMYIERALTGEEIVQQDTVEFGSFETRYTPIWNDRGEVIGMTGLSVDITPRVQAEAALRESEARFRTIFNSSPNGIALLDMEHNILLVNKTMEVILGFIPEEMKGIDLFDLIYPLDLKDCTADLSRLFAGERNLFKRELRFLRIDRQLVWVNLLISLVLRRDSSPEMAVLVVEDINSQKQLEAELEEIQSRLVESREKERLELAQELHDEPLQELYGLIYQINAVREMVSDPEVITEIDDVEKNLNRTISILRSICGDLRPPTLTPFGLDGAIREYSDRFRVENPSITLILELMYDGQTLPEHLRIALFRIYQQALNNIFRHAEATLVKVIFRYDDAKVELEIEDNGRGFEMPARMVDLVRQGHYGLAGAAERVEMLRGNFIVKSIPGKGTRIRVQAPLKQQVQN